MRRPLYPPGPGQVLRLGGPRPLRWTARRRVDGLLEFRCPQCGLRIAVNRWALVDFALRALQEHEQGHKEGRVFVAWRWT